MCTKWYTLAAANPKGFKPYLWPVPLFAERFKDMQHTHTHTLSKFTLESPRVAGHLLCSLMLKGLQIYALTTRPPPLLEGLRNMRLDGLGTIGQWTGLLFNYSPSLLNHSIGYIFGHPARVNRQYRQGKERSNSSLVLWFTPACTVFLWNVEYFSSKATTF